MDCGSVEQPLKISRCVFLNNNGNNGGAVKIDSSPNVIIEECMFTENKATKGGGIYNGNSNLLIKNSVFTKNIAGSGGGAIYLYAYDYNGDITITCCTFTDNQVPGPSGTGGAIYCYTHTNGYSVEISNTVLWNNIAEIGHEIYNYDLYGLWAATIHADHCCIENTENYLHDPEELVTIGANCVYTDPSFTDSDNPMGRDGMFATIDDGLQVLPTGSCIDTGTSVDTPEMDVIGKGRIDYPDVGSDPADIGAYETAVRWHVKKDATGTESGFSWQDAFKYLQDALAKAEVDGGDIWIATGTYKPDEGTGYTSGDQAASFELPDGVGIYGGFKGDETLLSQANWDVYETILDGDLNGDDEPGFTNNSDNSYQVVYSNGNDSATVLQGVTVRGGKSCISQ